MTARELFREIRNLDSQIDGKIDKLGELRNGASGIGGCDYSSERVQTSSSGEPPYVRRIEKILELDAEIDADIDRLVDLKMEAWQRMQKLSAKEQELLQLRYFEGRAWPEIAKQAGYTTRHIYRLHNQVLRKMDTQDIVPKEKESTRYS